VLITRRQLLSGAAVACASSALANLSVAQRAPADLRINGERLRLHLEQLSIYGRPTGGTFADGVNRVAYSDADIAARQYAVEAMRAAGLKPYIDSAGNIFRARSGTDSSLPRILFGSHIDSVSNGGNFDGDLGSMSAIEIMQTLEEHGTITQSPLEMVIWSNEEGEVGSAAAAGGLEHDALNRVFYGTRLKDGLGKIGGNPSRLDEARLTPRPFFAI
jgi:beta-ureidopropionase / N-carbamoyl-L-amino-acid hydrolase